ncbi:hypothetical protein BFL43_18290 [Williamsia sp. 1135]|nr:hypothetical protein BFL43_18290 [Williamsia sp. 1135]
MLVIIGIALLALSAGLTTALVALWTADSPGSWFNVIFTVMGAVFVAGGWAGYMSYLGDAAAREDAETRWAMVGPTAQPLSGIIADREVSLGETGEVSRFRLVITTEVGVLGAMWRPETRDSRAFLQTQVPGVGGVVRVWHAGTGEPFVVEVADPTVVA